MKGNTPVYQDYISDHNRRGMVRIYNGENYEF
jgi:hypothetical protein